MSDFERINRPRVEKILATLDTIERSAHSNKANPSDLLRPVRDRIGPSLELPPGVMPAPKDVNPRRDITLWQEAQTAPLSELMMAWSTINARLMDAVDELKEQAQ